MRVSAVRPPWLQARLRGVRSYELVSARQPPVRVFQLVDDLGIDLVFSADLPVAARATTTWERAEIIVRDTGNGDLDRKWQRVYCARALGRVILGPIGFTRDVDPTDLVMKLCDRFGDALVAPRFLLQPLLYGSLFMRAPDITEVATFFDAPATVILDRARRIKSGQIDP